MSQTKSLPKTYLLPSNDFGLAYRAEASEKLENAVARTLAIAKICPDKSVCLVHPVIADIAIPLHHRMDTQQGVQMATHIEDIGVFREIGRDWQSDRSPNFVNTQQQVREVCPAEAAEKLCGALMSHNVEDIRRGLNDTFKTMVETISTFYDGFIQIENKPGSAATRMQENGIGLPSGAPVAKHAL